jgi:hypothetical protein
MAAPMPRLAPVTRAISPCNGDEVMSFSRVVRQGSFDFARHPCAGRDPVATTPVQAAPLDSGLRRNDETGQVAATE